MTRISPRRENISERKIVLSEKLGEVYDIFELRRHEKKRRGDILATKRKSLLQGRASDVLKGKEKAE